MKNILVILSLLVIAPVMMSAQEWEGKLPEVVAKPVASVDVPVADTIKENVVFPPRPESLSALQMERLLNLARYVHNNEPDGIKKGYFFIEHRFKIEVDKLADGSFRLKSIKITKEYDAIRSYEFTIYPDGTVENVVSFASSYPKFLDESKDMRDMLKEEVSLWVDYETKRRYLNQMSESTPGSFVDTSSLGVIKVAKPATH